MRTPLTLSVLTGTVLSLTLVGFPRPGLTAQKGYIVLLSFTGKVELKRQDWSNGYRPAKPSQLEPSDRLRLATGASAKIFCGIDLETVRGPQEYRAADICPQVVKVDSQRRRRISRSANDPNSPYIISPRNTSILTGKPTLRWHPVEGIKKYQVQVRGPSVNWMTVVSKPEVDYDGEQPFTPGLRYRVIVTADNGASSSSEAVTGFTVLPDEVVRQVKSEKAQVQQLSLPQEEAAPALAHLYLSYGLKDDAIQVLEQLVKADSQTTAVYQLLGEIYQEVGLTRLARERYLQALELAKAADDLEGQAIAQANLGEVQKTLGELEGAIDSLQNAQAHYRVLGDKERAQELQKQIDELLPRV